MNESNTFVQKNDDSCNKSFKFLVAMFVWHICSLGEVLQRLERSNGGKQTSYFETGDDQAWKCISLVINNPPRSPHDPKIGTRTLHARVTSGILNRPLICSYL